jgi:cardiolipin synthase
MPKHYPNAGFSTYNQLTLVHGGKPYFQLLEELIEGAAHQILFQTYIFDAGNTGKRVAAALSRAARRPKACPMKLSVTGAKLAFTSDGLNPCYGASISISADGFITKHSSSICVMDWWAE